MGTKGNIKRSITDNEKNARTIKGIIMKTQNKLWIYGQGQKRTTKETGNNRKNKSQTGEERQFNRKHGK